MSMDKQGLVTRMAERFGVVGERKLFDTLKQTAFSGEREPSDAEMMALLVVSDQHGLNPFTREIYAFPNKKGGIIPVVGVDGWSRIANEHPQFDGVEFFQSENMVLMDDQTKSCPEWMECTVYRKDRKHPIKVREYLDEVYKAPLQRNGNRGSYSITGPWQSHPKRFLRHKTMIQAFRLAFGFAGIYDPDEATRIQEQEEKDITGMVEVVDAQAPTPQPEISQQQQPVIEHQQQADFMHQVDAPQMGQQLSHASVDPEVPPAQEEYAQKIEPHVQRHAFTPSHQLFEITTNLISRARDSGAWDTCFDYARNSWHGDEQAYVMSELTKAHQAACATH